MLKLTFIFILLILCHFIKAQNNPTTDKLQIELSKNSKEDTTRANILLQLARAFYMSSPAKTLEYSQQAYQLSERINFKKGIADGNRFQAIAQYSMGNFKDAQTSLLKSLAVNEEIKNNTGIMACLSMLGTVNTVQNNYSAALSYYQKVVRLGEKNKDDLNLGVAFTNMGVIYSEMKNYDSALKYFQDGLRLNTKINSKIGIAGSLANMGNVYFQTKNFPKALSYYQDALGKNIEIDNKLGIAREHGNIGNVFSELKNDIEAFKSYKNALEINESIKNKKGIAVSMQGIGNYYLGQKEYNSALEFTKKANEIATEIKIQDVQKETFYNLSTIYEKIGKLDSAYISFKKYTELKDNIDNEANRKQISRLEIQYEFDTKEEKYKTAELLANEKLSQQRLKLALNEANLTKSQKEKDLIRLNFLKTESELKAEKLEKLAKEKQLALVGKEVELKNKEILINNISIATSKEQKWYYLMGIGLLGIIGTLLFYQSQARKKTNTTLQKLNTNLDEANQIKAKFFAILSHDLRSPVANLINFLHLQKESPELLSPEIKQRNELKISESAENLLETMESMLLWSKSQMEHFEPKMKPIIVSDLFDYLQKFFANNDKIDFNFIDSAHLQLVTDEDYLKTIMQNLTSNAVKALAQTNNAKITWLAKQVDQQVILSIADNGPGISNEQKALLFSETSTIGSKNGFGFHLIRDLAKAIDCKIDLIQNNGQGAEFQLVINEKGK
jgi:signal transduction histidine kinase/TPR repeat protein